MGAENTTGPWLCLRCGVNGRPISIPSYRGFRRHLVNTHRERIDRRLCEHCGWRSRNDKELLHHLRVQHDILPSQGYDDFPACSFCPSIFLDKVGHEHPDKPLYQQQCMYCDGLFKDEGEIYNHMQSQHEAQAQNDGLIDYTDEEDNVYFAGEQAQPSSDNKIKILSSITISPKSSGVKAAAGKLGAEKTEAAAVDDGTEKAAVKEADVDEAEANADADTKNETVNQDADDDDDEESGEAKKVEDESEKIVKAKENLKLLTGDWSDDEEEEVETTATTSKSSTQKEEDGSATKRSDY